MKGLFEAMSQMHKLTDLLISYIGLNWLQMIGSQQFTCIAVDIINLALAWLGFSLISNKLQSVQIC